MKQYIGIDPSFRKNGFAVCVIGGGEAKFYILDGFLQFIEWVTDWKEGNEFCPEFQKELFFAVENSNLQNVTFQTSHNKNIAAKMSRDAGKNQAISQCTVDYLKAVFGDENVYELSPLQKGKKIEDTAVFLAYAESLGIKLINYKNKKNEQDKRDAFLLATKIMNK